MLLCDRSIPKLHQREETLLTISRYPSIIKGKGETQKMVQVAS